MNERQSKYRNPRACAEGSLRIALYTVNTLGACQYYLTRLQSTCPRVQNHYKGLFVALTCQLVPVAQRISMVACNVIG